MNRALAIIIFASLASPVRAQPASCKFLVDIGGKHYLGNGAGVSADGLVAVGSASDGYSKAFRWSAATGGKFLGSLAGGNGSSDATAASLDGSVVVGMASTDVGYRAYRWTAFTDMVSLGDLGGGESYAEDLSADGNVVIGYSRTPGNFYSAFRWTERTRMVDLGNLPGGDSFSTAFGTSDDGTVIVGASSSEQAPAGEPYRWTKSEGMVGLGGLPGQDPSGTAIAVNADGTVVVGYTYSSKGPQAFRWTKQSGMTGLGDLPGGDFYSAAYDVSADGRVVVGFSNTGFSQNEAFFWTPETGMVNLREWLVAHEAQNLEGRILVNGESVSANGKTIVGYATNPQEPFVAFLGSEPCYADCDASGSLDIDDFICFQTLFATGDFAADCDGDQHIDIDDFICFQTAFGLGCS